MTHASIGIAYLDGPRLRRSLMAAADWVDAGREELNRMNVFPVPDGDTGTNFAATLRAVAVAVRELENAELPEITGAMAEACMFAARGNSGLLLSQFLIGFQESLGDRLTATASEVAAALRSGSERLHSALEEPLEGTILTVCRHAAEVAERVAQETENFEDLMRLVLDGANDALASTPELLDVLKEAGVVDAGGKGFVRLLEGIVMLIDGDPIEAVEPTDYAVPAAALSEVASDRDYQYCTEVLVSGEGVPSATEVRHQLRELGGSLVVISTGGRTRIHIHTDEPERVFDMAGAWGEVESTKADDMREQHAALQHEQRSPVALVADSSCDLPDDILDRHGIIVVPLQVIHGDRTYRDKVDSQTLDIYSQMRDGEIFTTSQPSPGAWVEAFRDAEKGADKTLAIILSSALSGTFAAAQSAARALDSDDIGLFDSRTASLGLGLLVLRAIDLINEGVPVEELPERLEAVRQRCGGIFTVDVLDNLVRSGRVGRGKAWLGGLLDIKPILEVSQDGRVVPLDKARGREAVFNRVFEQLEKRLTPRPARLRFGVVHADAAEVAEKIRAEVVARFDPFEIIVAPVTPAIGVHAGPGAWGVFYQVED